MVQDIRYAIRAMLKTPAFAATVVVTLGLGIGAASAIFAVVNAALLRPLPYRDADRLVFISALLKGEDWPISYPEFSDWQTQSRAFALLTATVDGGDATLTGIPTAQWVRTAQVSASFFPVLGVQPLLGRGFLPEEDRPGAPGAIVLSHDLWQRSFGLDRQVIGRTVTVGKRQYQVVGVMPPGFDYPKGADAWLPLGPHQILNRRARGIWVIGRLRPGVSLAAAAADMELIAARLRLQHPVSNANFSTHLESLRDRIVGDARPRLLILFGFVALLLCVACANAASVLLAWGISRRRELAVRVALGAPRTRVFRQMLTESSVLSLCALFAGLTFAFWATAFLKSLAPVLLIGADGIRVDRTVLLFAVLASCCTVVLFGSATAFQAARTDLISELRSSPCDTSGFGRSRLWSGLLIAQLALSTILLVGSGLLLRSLSAIANSHLGFSPDHLLCFRVVLPDIEPALQAGVVKAIASRIQGLPGVQDVSAASTLPLGKRPAAGSFTIVGDPPLPAGERNIADFGCVMPGFLRVSGIPLIEGRDFDSVYHGSNTRTDVLINKAMALRFFSDYPTRSPVGRVLRTWGNRESRIVGVIGNVARESITTAASPEVYADCAQEPARSLNFVVRAAGDPLALGGFIRGLVQDVDHRVPVVSLESMREALDRSMSYHRISARMTVGFACLSLLLAGAGLYGFLSYLAQLRTREIGIRIALGAQRSDIAAVFLRRSAALACGGIGLGLSGAIPTSSMLGKLLYGVSPAGPAAFVIAPAFVLAVSLGASLVPACRASQIDPVRAIRASS